MRERPIQDLVDGLQQLGVDAQCTAGTGCPPVTVNANGLPSGKVRVTLPLNRCLLTGQGLQINHDCDCTGVGAFQGMTWCAQMLW